MLSVEFSLQGEGAGGVKISPAAGEISPEYVCGGGPTIVAEKNHKES